MTTKLLLGVFSLLITFSVSAQKKGSYQLDEVYQMSETGTLYLRTEDATVRIKGSDRKDVHLEVDRYEDVKGASNRREFAMEVEERSGDLYIKERRQSGTTWNIGYYRLDYEINIEMPLNGSLRIDGEDDDYIIRSVNGEIQIRTEDGNVELVDCQGDDFEIELEDGDLRMDGGKGSLYIEIEDGDADIRDGDFKNVEIKVEDGEVTLETNLDDQGRYDFTGDDANLQFVVLKGGGEFTILKDDGRVSASSAFDLERETERREEYTLAGGKAEVNIDTEDGRIRLSKK